MLSLAATPFVPSTPHNRLDQHHHPLQPFLLHLPCRPAWDCSPLPPPFVHTPLPPPCCLGATPQVGCGADELIDLLMRCVLDSGDAIVDCPPTFTMYVFDAAVNNARVVTVPRLDGFKIDVEGEGLAPACHAVPCQAMP